MKIWVSRYQDNAIETSPGVEQSERYFKPVHDIIGAFRVKVESELKDIS